MSIYSKRRNGARVLAICSLIVMLSACSEKKDVDGPTLVHSTVRNDADDALITGKVQATLLASDGVKSFPIKVATENGEVILSGFVNNQQQVDQSIDLAKSVKGVKLVINQLALKDNTTSADDNVSDGLVTTTVKTALLNDELLKSFDISVVTRHGEVLLSGFVDNQAQAARSVQVAQGIEGVKSVMNHMVVKG